MAVRVPLFFFEGTNYSAIPHIILYIHWSYLQNGVVWPGWMVWGLNPGVGTRLPAPIQTGPGAHPASWTTSNGYRVSFLLVKRWGSVIDHPPPTDAEVKKIYLPLLSSSCAFIACSVVNFTRHCHIYTPRSSTLQNINRVSQIRNESTQISSELRYVSVSVIYQQTKTLL
jgi:hypothetical protein